MPRAKSRPASRFIEVNEDAVAQANEASRAVAALDGATAEQALRLNAALQLIGGMNVAASIAESINAATVRAFIKLREERLYAGLPYRDEHGVMRVVTTLEEFCPQFLGVSYETMRERVKQLELLGDQAFAGAMRLGLTFKQLRALEGSDEDARKKVAAALERGARSEVMDLVEELIDERRERDKELIDAKQQLEAKDKVLDQKNRKLDELAGKALDKPEWHQQLEKAMASVDQVYTTLQLACAEAARLAETISELEFEGVERESDLLALRAQVAVQFEGRCELWLDRGVALILRDREAFIGALLSMARTRLPDEVKAKLFKENT